MDMKHSGNLLSRGTRAFLAALLTAVAAGGVFAETRAEKLRAALDSRDRDYVFVTMHRGDWRHAPENSVDAIKGSIAMGADIVEIDIHMTADSVLVLMHDKDAARVLFQV